MRTTEILHSLYRTFITRAFFFVVVLRKFPCDLWDFNIFLCYSMLDISKSIGGKFIGMYIIEWREMCGMRKAINSIKSITTLTRTHTHTSTSINGSRESNTNNKYRDLENVRYQSEWHISQMQKAEIANAILRPFLPLMYSFRSHKHTHTFINRLSFEIKMIIRFGPKQPNELNECKSDKVETRT